MSFLSIKSYFWPQVIFRTASRYNSKIEVVEYLGRRSLKCGGLTQSGSIVEDIYKKIIDSLPYTVNRIQYSAYGLRNALILGLGAGTIVKLLNGKNKKIEVTGVEIDKKIIEIGDKYFDFKKYKNLNIIEGDAVAYLNKITEVYDFIFVDLYLGDKINNKVKTESFFTKLKSVITRDGTIVFNKLNYSHHKKDNEKFINNLNEVFSLVTVKKSYSNLLIFVRA